MTSPPSLPARCVGPAPSLVPSLTLTVDDLVVAIAGHLAAGNALRLGPRIVLYPTPAGPRRPQAFVVHEENDHDAYEHEPERSTEHVDLSDALRHAVQIQKEHLGLTSPPAPPSRLLGAEKARTRTTKPLVEVLTPRPGASLLFTPAPRHHPQRT